MNHKPSVRDRFARVAAFAAISSIVLAALFVPIVAGHSQAAAASQEQLGAPQQATVAPTEAPPAPTEAPPAPTTAPPAPTEAPPAPTEAPPAPTTAPPAPTEAPPAPTEAPPAPTEAPPAPTAVPTKAPPAPTPVPTKPPPAPTPKPADPQPAQTQAQPAATAVPTVAAPITTTQAVSSGVACSVVIRTGLLVRATPARTGASLGIILRTEAFTASGRTANSGWVSGTTAKGVKGWVLSNGLRCQTPVRRLAVLSVQTAPAKLVPTPTPSS